MVERIRSTITLRHRIPEYQRRAECLRQRAIIESIVAGFFIKEDEGVDLVENAQTSIIPVGRKEIEFAVDANGICFARIKGGKYYQLDTSVPENLLRQSENYERLTKSTIRRLIEEPYERTFGKPFFDIQESLGKISITMTLLVKRLEEMAERANKLPEGKT